MAGMRYRIRAMLIAAATLAALASPAAAFAQTRLIATVGTNDAHEISLTHENGTRVTDIPAGTYTIEVRDRSEMHNFHLSGPGVDQRTDVEAITTVTWTVTLRDNARYRFQCDPHAPTMNGTFTTGGGPPPQPQPPPPPAPRPGTRLIATVGPGFTISLRTVRGARVTRLRRGRYVITVRDRSRMHNFHLFGRGVNKRTTAGFRGTTTWRVTFRRGARYRFRCDPHPTRMRGSFRAT
jgi:plastocyanin